MGLGTGWGFKPRGAHVSAKVGFEPGSVLGAYRAGVAEQLAAWRLEPARERGEVQSIAQVLAANLHQRRKGRGRGGGALGELMQQAPIRLGGAHDGRTHVKALDLSRESQVRRVAVRRRQGSRAARHVLLGEGEGEVGRRPVWDHGRRSRGLRRRSRRGRPLSRSRWAAHSLPWSGRRHCRGHCLQHGFRRVRGLRRPHRTGTMVRPELKMDHTSLVNVLTSFSCGKPCETRNESGEAKRRPVGSNSRDKDHTHTVHLVALPVFMT